MVENSEHFVGQRAQATSSARSLCDENVQTEMGPFTSSLDGGGQQIQEVPFVYVPNIIRKIADIIEHLEQ